jgi:hypothetical protein
MFQKGEKDKGGGETGGGEAGGGEAGGGEAGVRGYRKNRTKGERLGRVGHGSM